jgi:hypothetical protein
MRAAWKATGIVLGVLLYGTLVILLANFAGGQILLGTDPHMDYDLMAAYAWLGIVVGFAAVGWVWWMMYDYYKEDE